MTIFRSVIRRGVNDVCMMCRVVSLCCDKKQPMINNHLKELFISIRRDTYYA